MFPTWLVDRGEAASFLIVGVALALSARVVAGVTGAAPRRVEDVYWWGGILFVVVGRCAYVATTSPDLLTDVAVLIRFTDGVDPLAGAAAALGWTLWKTRAGRADGALWAAAVAGIALAAAAYDLACPVREACYGVPASGPLGFPMHGLAESRVPTPVIEGIALLVLLGVSTRLLDRWAPARVGWALLAGVAGVRLAALPLSAGGFAMAEAVVLTATGGLAAGLAFRARMSASAS